MSLSTTALATQTNRLKEIYVAVVPSGTYSIVGDLLDLTALKNPNFLPEPFLSRVPLSIGVMNEEMSGFYVGIIPGTTLNNFKVKFYQPGGTELPAGNYPAPVLNGTLQLVLLAPGRS